MWSHREEGPGHCSISKKLLSVQKICPFAERDMQLVKRSAILPHNAMAQESISRKTCFPMSVSKVGPNDIYSVECTVKCH